MDINLFRVLNYANKMTYQKMMNTDTRYYSNE